MHAWPLIWTDRLDARPTEIARIRPWSRSVCIPCRELAARTHELPPPGQLLFVLDDPAGHGRDAVDWLRSQGRKGLPVVAESGDGWATVGEGGTERAALRCGAFRLWRANAFLEQELARLRVSDLGAVDLACGTGRDAAYLASAGWSVTGVDLLNDALQRAELLYRNSLPPDDPGRRAEWMRIDLEADPDPPRRWGLAVCFRFLHRPLLRRLRDWIAPGGRFIGGTFTKLHRARHGKPARDAHLLDPGELPCLFEGWRIERYEERWRDDAHLALVHAAR